MNDDESAVMVTVNDQVVEMRFGESLQDVEYMQMEPAQAYALGCGLISRAADLGYGLHEYLADTKPTHIEGPSPQPTRRTNRPPPLED